MRTPCLQQRGVDCRVRRDRQEIDHSRRPHGLLESDVIGGPAIGKEMAGAVHMGKSVDGKTLPGDLKKVTSSVVGDQTPLHRPAKMVDNRHGEIDQGRHSYLNMPLHAPIWRRANSARRLDEFNG